MVAAFSFVSFRFVSSFVTEYRSENETKRIREETVPRNPESAVSFGVNGRRVLSYLNSRREQTTKVRSVNFQRECVLKKFRY